MRGFHLRHTGLGKCWWGLDVMRQKITWTCCDTIVCMYAKRQVLYVIFVLENMKMNCLLSVFLLSIVATVDIN